MGWTKIYFFQNYEIDGGLISDDSSDNELKKQGYLNDGRLAVDNEYVQFATSAGNIDWSQIEYDYDRAKDNGSFEILNYYFELSFVTPDDLRQDFNNFTAIEEKIVAS